MLSSLALAMPLTLYASQVGLLPYAWLPLPTWLRKDQCFIGAME